VPARFDLGGRAVVEWGVGCGAGPVEPANSPSGAYSGCTSAQTPRPRGAPGDRARIPCTVARTARPPGALRDRACSVGWEASTRAAGRADSGKRLRGPLTARRTAPGLHPGRLTQASSTHPARGHDVSAVARAWEGPQHAPLRDGGGACSDPVHRPRSAADSVQRRPSLRQAATVPNPAQGHHAGGQPEKRDTSHGSARRTCRKLGLRWPHGHRAKRSPKRRPKPRGVAANCASEFIAGLVGLGVQVVRGRG
jgi:hypothetical protein